MNRIQQVLDEALGPIESAQSIQERSASVSYWRTMPGGHRVGFKGSPGKGTPVVGNAKVIGKIKGGEVKNSKTHGPNTTKKILARAAKAKKKAAPKPPPDKAKALRQVKADLDQIRNKMSPKTANAVIAKMIKARNSANKKKAREKARSDARKKATNNRSRARHGLAPAK